MLETKSRGMYMNLLMTLDRNYVPQLNVMLFSALHSDSAAYFDVYLLHDEQARNVLIRLDLTSFLIGVLPESHLLPYFCGQISAGHA